jgi:hypothetical protein
MQATNTNIQLNSRAVQSISYSSVASSAFPLNFDSSVIASHMPSSMTLPQAIQDELQLESSMHVTWFSAVSCEAAFGLPAIMSAPAVEASVLQEEGHDGLHSKMQSGSFDMGFKRDASVKSLAACLATPSEGVPDSPERPIKSRVAVTNLSNRSVFLQLKVCVLQIIFAGMFNIPLNWKLKQNHYHGASHKAYIVLAFRPTYKI